MYSLPTPRNVVSLEKQCLIELQRQISLLAAMAIVRQSALIELGCLPYRNPKAEEGEMKHHGSNCFVAVLGGVVCCSLRWRLGAPGQRKKVLRLSCSTLRGGSAIGFLSYCGASEGPFSILQIWCSRVLGKSNNFRLCIFSTYGLSSTADLQFPWRLPLD